LRAKDLAFLISISGAGVSGAETTIDQARNEMAPVLALFGELDNNILAAKNRAAWEAALNAGRHPDYTLRILPRANHALLEARLGNNAEMKSLQRFVPAYSEVVLEWLRKHLAGFAVAK
jgi:dienelactone hydrolase